MALFDFIKQRKIRRIKEERIKKEQQIKNDQNYFIWENYLYNYFQNSTIIDGAMQNSIDEPASFLRNFDKHFDISLKQTTVLHGLLKKFYLRRRKGLVKVMDDVSFACEHYPKEVEKVTKKNILDDVKFTWDNMDVIWSP